MSEASGSGPNDEAIEAWDTVLFEKFTRFRHILVKGYEVFSEAVFERLALRPGAKVIDLGCGFGDTTLAIARQVAPAEVKGIDCAPRFIEQAAREAQAANVQNARFEVRDVQTEDFGGPYDVAFSRMGVMFFQSAVQAMRNVRRHLAPNGKITFIVWRKREDNLWLYNAEKVVRELVPDMHDNRGDAVTCGPGPFSMAGADLVSEQLTKAGYHRIAFERFDTSLLIGRDLDEAVEFAMALGPAGEIMRLAGETGEQKKPAVVAALRKVFEEMVQPDGTVRGRASVWFITASPRPDK